MAPSTTYSIGLMPTVAPAPTTIANIAGEYTRKRVLYEHAICDSFSHYSLFIQTLFDIADASLVPTLNEDVSSSFPFLA